MRIIVTAGATREPIDAVRFLSNVSTGATGAALAEVLAGRGHAVTLLRGEGTVAPRAAVDAESFSSAGDLGARLRRRLVGGAYDAVIMAAAVADYRPEAAFRGKAPSSEEILTLRLVRNPKLLPSLKSLSPRPLVVVGFKLTVGADEASRRAAVAGLFSSGGVDAVVHNDLEEMRRAGPHPFRLFRGPDAEPERCRGPEELAAALGSVLERQEDAHARP
jgi:phosphopantothenoylcysteine decarboxylase/phosphopantothenate--cysteine ligase